MNETLEEMIQRYKNEMMRYAPAAKASMQEEPEAIVPLAEAPIVLQEEPTIVMQEEEPSAVVQEEESSLESAANEPEAPYLLETENQRAEKETEEWDVSEATLTIQVYSANGALPIEGAVVTVSRPIDDKKILIAALITDASGRTAGIVLPAPAAEESTTPNGEHPFSIYDVRTDKEGYYSVSNLSLPLFGGIPSLQPVEMIPIPERESDVNEIQIFESQNPDL